jgi:alcohol dehydrogenase YqhD (iron-dependent ADH family)
MENFEFFSPTKVIFGKDTVSRIGDEVRCHGYRRVLMIAGGGSIKGNGVYDATVQSLKTAGVEMVEFWGVRPNPVLSTVYAAIQMARETQVDAILAVGGGSVVDSAKAVAGGFYLKDIWEAFENKVLIEKALPLFVILTLSATGSEMNAFAVVTKTEENKKWAVGSPALFPVVSVIDPSVQVRLPWHQTVNGGVDALSHIMEFYFLGSVEETTIAIDECLLRTIIRTLDRLQADPGDYDSRANLAWAATLALNGISGAALQGGDWATHMIEHGLSALHPEVAHATGLGILFPAWIQHVQDCNLRQFQRWAERVWETASVEEGLIRLRDTLKRWKAPISLREVGVKREEIKTIADNVMLRAPLGRLKNLDQQDVEAILELAW